MFDRENSTRASSGQSDSPSVSWRDQRAFHRLDLQAYFNTHCTCFAKLLASNGKPASQAQQRHYHIKVWELEEGASVTVPFAIGVPFVLAVADKAGASAAAAALSLKRAAAAAAVFLSRSDFEGATNSRP